jgi:hypothetical protein
MLKFSEIFLVVFSIVVAVTETGTLKAQNTPGAPVAEPQYINTFSSIDVSVKLIDLEPATVTFYAKTKVFPGYATVKMVAEFKPGRSSVRVLPGARFVVRGRSPLDPASRYELRVLKSSKDHREIVITQGHGSVFGGGATSGMDEGLLPIRFEEYGVSSYRVIPEHPLPPGEYALGMRGMGTELYCFGVDR